MKSPSTNEEMVVLMPARNEAKTIPATVSAVNASEGVPDNFHVLVCANACTDRTVDVLEAMKAKHDNMDYVIENVPGKPRALNALIDKAEQEHRMGANDVVVFLDANAHVQPETLSLLSSALKQDKSLNAISANDVALAPKSGSFLDHFLFGMSDISLSTLALRDRKASCTAVRGNVIRGTRFPENVIADDLWLSMYLGMDSVDTHASAMVTVPRTKNAVDFFSNSARHMMGLYQLEEYFPAHEVRSHLPMGIHEHASALMTEPELQDQFSMLPGVYQAATLIAMPVHAVIKAAAWVGYRLMPRKQNHSLPIPRQTEARTHSRRRSSAQA
ncbi:MAG: glycosyltransferase [archaeon]